MADIQRKLAVGRPDGRYEEEADRVGEQVMRMRGQQGRHDVLPITLPVQRQARDIGPGKDFPSIVTNALSSPGRPLAAGARAFFAAQFTRDFSNIRVHDNAVAAESARALDARAYTVGPHLVFGAGEYAPETERGKRLLAHELTHAVQQDAAGGTHAEASRSVLQRSEREGEASGSAGGGKTIILVSGGYDEYGSEADEAKLLHTQPSRWQPGTKDFLQTAWDSGAGKPYKAMDAKHFFGPLREEAGPFGRIVFIGHGGHALLRFSGHSFITTEGLDTDSVPAWAPTIDEEIKPKLTPATTIDLYSCNAAEGSAAIMMALAAAFGVCVRGYGGGIEWCVSSHFDENDPNGGRITSRGRWVAPGVAADNRNCNAPEWNHGVASATPPEKVCPP
jgi:hypothetical protein